MSDSGVYTSAARNPLHLINSFWIRLPKVWEKQLLFAILNYKFIATYIFKFQNTDALINWQYETCNPILVILKQAEKHDRKGLVIEAVNIPRVLQWVTWYSTRMWKGLVLPEPSQFKSRFRICVGARVMINFNKTLMHIFKQTTVIWILNRGLESVFRIFVVRVDRNLWFVFRYI